MYNLAIYRASRKHYLVNRLILLYGKYNNVKKLRVREDDKETEQEKFSTT